MTYITYVCAGICILALLEKPLGWMARIKKGWKQVKQLCPKEALWDLISSIDLSLRLRSMDVPYPLIAGFVEGNKVCSIYWMVSNPEDTGKVLGKLKLARKLQYTMRQDPFWTQYNTLLEEL